MRRSYAWILVGVAWLAVCALPVSAAPAGSPASLADKYKLTDPEAVQHFRMGNAAYKAGVDKRRPRADRERDLERAITEYTAGQAIQDRPVFDFNLGLACKALGRTDEAIEHLQRFIDLADDTVSAAARTDAESKLAALDPGGERRAELARRRAAPSPPAATPVVNPPVTDPPLTGSAPGAVAPVALSASSPPGQSETIAGHSSIRWTRVGGWGLIGAGLIGGGIAGWLALDAQSLTSQSNDAQVNRGMAERQALSDRADARRRSAVIVGIGSGALVVSGALILVLSSGGDPPPTRTGWNVGITGNGLAIRGRF